MTWESLPTSSPIGAGLSTDSTGDDDIDINLLDNDDSFESSSL
eukprot:CAMPEP_0201557906 /NCGR_PEP_ID=MMETSP0173_2-20130828/64564_1 /ASSEMBLY_ACC=CAM_ASM_000268 /TAXON_ID=218659 /ORGANISM="Vexillifera sp., Strain DIVA3 564/2" /LENGTH=42 /DNA_ID= /DNA_START= /DNA_END= /DNA_ORIENTATION=